MPKLNIDELKQLSEPIEIVLEGKTYVVAKVSSDLMDQVTKVAEEGAKDSNTLARQLGLLLAVDPAEFKGCDVRKLGKALGFITKAVIQGLDEKNV